jgi:hypothetical protein
VDSGKDFVGSGRGVRGLKGRKAGSGEHCSRVPESTTRASDFDRYGTVMPAQASDRPPETSLEMWAPSAFSLAV